MTPHVQVAPAPAPTGRGYDTSFENQKGLLHTFARKVFGRLSAANVNITYEDIYQEMCLSYTQALRTYDPSRGITFSAYMGRSVYNNINFIAKKMIRERVELGMTLFSEFSNGDDETGFSIEEVIHNEDSPSLSPEALAVRNIEVRERIAQLSRNGKRILRELISPSDEVAARHQAYIRSVGEKIKRGEFKRAPSTTLTVKLIGKYLCLTREEMIHVCDEYERVLGVSING